MKRFSLGFIGFLQALGVILYCGLVATLLSRGEELFGHLPEEYFGPLVFLTLFSTSALICALITLGYPFMLWQNKQTKKAMKLILYTALWMVGFVLLTFYSIASLK